MDAEINMDALLGIGGEAIVIERQNQAFKIIPLDGADAQTKKSIRKAHAEIRKILKAKNATIPTIAVPVEVATKTAPPVPNPKIAKTAPPIVPANQTAPPVAAPVQVAPEIEAEKVEFKVAETNLETTKILEDKSEFECSSIRHQNVINYENVTLDIVEELVAMIIGKYRF